MKDNSFDRRTNNIVRFWEIDHMKWIHVKVFVCFWSNVRMNVPSSSQQRRKNMFYACKVSDVCTSGVHQKRFIGLIKYNE